MKPYFKDQLVCFFLWFLKYHFVYSRSNILIDLGNGAEGFIGVEDALAGLALNNQSRMRPMHVGKLDKKIGPNQRCRMEDKALLIDCGVWSLEFSVLISCQCCLTHAKNPNAPIKSSN